MKVLMDFHHHDLWESMELLADRLGWTLYRPIGMEWYEQGYWNHERKFWGDAVARQYLQSWDTDTDGLRPDWSHIGRFYKLLTLDEARDLRPDLVLSSLAHNHEGFARFASEVGAMFGLQIGNVRFSGQDMAEDRWDLAAFGLVSGIMPVVPPKPHVVYHQEFDISRRGFASAPPPRGQFAVGIKEERDLTPGWFDREPSLEPVADGAIIPPLRVYASPPQRFRVSSFVQCYPQDAPAYDYWRKAAEQVPEMSWKVWGAYGEAPADEFAAGNLSVCNDVAIEMRASDVGWHAKRWSDGYGHVIHNWFAVGRPVLGFQRYYADQLAGRLWVEGETAWDIESRSLGEVADLLRRFRDDEDFHLRACEASAERFRQVVDFDQEEQEIRALLAQVLP